MSRMRKLASGVAILSTLTLVACSPPAVDILREQAETSPGYSEQILDNGEPGGAPDSGNIETNNSTIKYRVNSDRNGNKADNQMYGGPNAFTFFDNADPRGAATGDPGTVEVFTKNGSIPVTLTAEGNDRYESTFTVGIQQEPDADLMAVTTARVRVTPEGLAADYYEFQSNVYDYSGQVVETFAFEVEEDSYVQGAGLFGDTVLLRYSHGEKDFDQPYNEHNIEYVSAFSPSTGEELWTKTVVPRDGGASIGGGGDCSGSSVLGVLSARNFDSSPDGHAIYGERGGLTSVDPRTGEEQWVVQSPRCYLGSAEPGGSFPLRIVSYNGNSLHDLRNGATVAEGGVSYAIDHQNALLAVSYVYRSSIGSSSSIIGDGPAFEIIDLSNGETIYELPAEDGLALDSLSVISAFDEKIWIRTGQDYSVIDARSGEPVPDNEEMVDFRSEWGVPLYKGDTWMVTGPDSRSPRHFIWNDNGAFTMEDLQLEEEQS